HDVRVRGVAAPCRARRVRTRARRAAHRRSRAAHRRPGRRRRDRAPARRRDIRHRPGGRRPRRGPARGGDVVTARHLEVRPGTYRDSVCLMQVSRAVQGVPGVSVALVAMATELNLELATGMGFTPTGAAPDDMLVAVAAVDEAALAAALDRLGAERRGPGRHPGPADAAAPPRTVGAAVRRSSADLVLVSTPGRYAFLDAMDALEAGASVLVFSDNVPVEQEVRLKEAALRRGLLVMGPD